MHDPLTAFILGFLVGVSALVLLGSRVANQIRATGAEVAGTIERLAQAVENRESNVQGSECDVRR